MSARNPSEAVSAAMTARERPPAPLNAYGSDRAWSCLHCDGWPMGGLPPSMPPAEALEAAARLGIGVAVFNAEGSLAGVVCGPDHARSLNISRVHNSLPAYTTIAPAKAPLEQLRHVPSGESYLPRVDRVVRSTCRACGSQHRLCQSKIGHGDWTPDAAHVLDISGWRVDPSTGAKFCSRLCYDRSHPPPSKVPTDAPQQPVAVLTLPVNYTGKKPPVLGGELGPGTPGVPEPRQVPKAKVGR